MKTPFKLVPDQISHDTIGALEHLLDEARRGKLIGLTFAAMCKGGKYYVDSAGEAHRSKTFALGMVAVLANKLQIEIRGDKA